MVWIYRLADSGTSFFPPYVAGSLVLAVAWLFFSYDLAVRDGLRVICNRDIWLSRSTVVDLLFCVPNLTVIRAAAKGLEIAGFVAALQWWGQRDSLTDLKAPPVVEGLIATAITMLAIDFASYAVHRLMHTRALWWVHSLHHSATRLTPLTAYRQHPLEPILLGSARGLASGLGLGCWRWFSAQNAPVLTVLGMGAGFFAYMFTVNLHHASVPLRYPRWVRGIVLSPHIHHLHHSSEVRHFGHNFGVVFSVWDRMFGTYLDEDVGLNELRFGTSP